MHEKILVIDDESLILSSIQRALDKIGYEIVTTIDMQGFHNALAAKKFDMVIMDLHMKGINAEELIQEAKKFVPAIKFLAISGSTQPENTKNFLQKPFKIDELRERVRKILDEPPGD